MMRFPVFYSLCLLAVIVSCCTVLAQRLKICKAGRWKCANSWCISIKLRCDGVNNCRDNSDEENCEQWTCPANRWKCSNHRCIKLSDRCDGSDDCGDNSDEENCGQIKIDCPSYVMEKSNLTCTCHAKMGRPHNVTWPGHSQSGSLSLTNVQRSDNGTQYTCLLTAKGVEEEAVYTLRVAYGPYPDKVNISPSQSIRNGTQPITVTCNAEDTYPTPYYQWGGILCQHPSSVNTCTFIPDPTNRYGTWATCRAESVTLADPSHKYEASVRGTASQSPRLNITFVQNCGEDFVANSSAQYIESPGYPSSYANNQYCVWHITAPKGQVLWLTYQRMSIDCNNDFAEVFDGDEKSGRSFGPDCKYSWSPYQTTDGLMTLTFNTDYRRRRSYYSGIRVVFRTIPTCGGHIEVNRTIQTIQSPGYPTEGYMNNMRCVWNITAKPGFYIRFNFTDFGIQKSRRCRWDSVKLLDGKGEKGRMLGTYCGYKERSSKAKFKPVTSYTNHATIVFKTSPSYSGKGFNLHIEATKSCNGRASWECSSGQCVNGTDRCDGKIDCDDGSDEQNCVSA